MCPQTDAIGLRNQLAIKLRNTATSCYTLRTIDPFLWTMETSIVVDLPLIPLAEFEAVLLTLVKKLGQLLIHSNNSSSVGLDAAPAS